MSLVAPTTSPSTSTSAIQKPIDRLTEAAHDAPAAAIDATSALLEQISGTSRGAQARQASVIRALRAVADLAEQSDTAALTEAASEGSDLAVLLALLDQPELLAHLRARDPLAGAKLRGLRSREALLAAEGGALTAQEAGAILGITRQAIDNRRKRGKLVAVELGRRGYAYPAWQLAGGSVLPGLDQVLVAFAGSGSWSLITFMLNGNAWLDGQRPLDALRAARIAEVVHAASLYGEQSAA